MPTGEFGVHDTFRNQQVNMTTLGTEIATGAASSGAITINAYNARVTSEALTTAQNVKYTLTVTNNKIAAGDHVHVTIGNGTNSAGTPLLQTVTPAAGSVVIVVANKHDTAVALNGTLIFMITVIKALTAGQPN
jgi:hypothetical protein